MIKISRTHPGVEKRLCLHINTGAKPAATVPMIHGSPVADQSAPAYPQGY